MGIGSIKSANRFLCISMVITMLMCTYCQPAEAQFLKKLFGKKEQPVKKKPVVKDKAPLKDKVVKKEKPAKKKRSDIDYPNSVYKQRYRVDVLVPLYLNELVKNDKPVFKGKLPDKAIAGLDFYEGIKLAADSLSNFLYSIDVYIHDVADTSSSPEALVKKHLLDESDLIIGAVQTQSIPVIAEFAKEHHINFVSALSPADGGVKENPYFTLLQPSLQSHCEWIMHTIFKKYGHATPVVLYRNSIPAEAKAYTYLKAEGDNIATKVLCNTPLKKQQVQSLFDSSKTNLVVMSILDTKYAETILLQLNEWFPGYKFEIYGMPTWRNIPTLKKANAYPNAAIYITTPFYFDPSTPWAQAVANSYKKDMGSSKINEMVYRGYEAMCWYAYLLTKYGTVFNDKLGDNGSAPFTRYTIKPKWDKDENLLYLENRHIYMYRYQSSSYIIEQ